MINILLSGCNGRMGQVITELSLQHDDVKIIAGCDIASSKNNDYPVYKSLDQVREKIDVIIDFSHPSVLNGLLDYAEKKGIPAVIATTGLGEEQLKRIKSASSKIPVFFSANMSLGVNVIMDVVKRVTNVLYDSFDIEIIEKHHNQKLDAPSGTALAIADAINSVLDEKYTYKYDRYADRKKRSKKEIGIHAVRGGNIVGEHTVLFAGVDEIVEITHKANSKNIFGQGAIKAAKFIAGQRPGLYNMNSISN